MPVSQSNVAVSCRSLLVPVRAMVKLVGCRPVDVIVPTLVARPCPEKNSDARPRASATVDMV